MSQIQANIGDSVRKKARFSDFVFFAIEASESIKGLSARWGVPDESIRRYRDGQATPSFDRLMEIRFSDAERVALCRLLSKGRVKIEPLNADELDRHRQGELSGIQPFELQGRVIELAGQVHKVTEVVHGALADGQVDADEARQIETAIDAVQATASCIRPSVFGKLRSVVCRCLRRREQGRANH